MQCDNVITSDLIGIINLINKSLVNNVKLIFVFDGDCPTIKFKTIVDRSADRDSKIIQQHSQSH